MANTKITKKDYFKMLLAIEDVKANEGLVTFINHEVELLEKKNSGERKLTATQKENEDLKDSIYISMEQCKKYTISDMIKEIPAISDLTNQRVSALVRQLINDGKIVRTEEKKKAYFEVVVD